MTTKAYITIGAPGCGKSTWATKFVAENPNTVLLCPDTFRAKFGWGEGDQSVSGKAFAEVKRLMGEALDEGKDVVIDATNMYRKTRRDFINIAHGRGASSHAVVFEATKELLLERNEKRGALGGRNVPEHVIDSMLSKYERPDDQEFCTVEFVTKID